VSCCIVEYFQSEDPHHHLRHSRLLGKEEMR
jgi:hypothetical protein